MAPDAPNSMMPTTPTIPTTPQTPPRPDAAPSALPLLVALESLSPQARVEGDQASGFVVVHPYGREIYDRHGQARSERNDAHAALPASAPTAQFPLKLAFEQGGRRREMQWVLKVKPPAGPAPAVPAAATSAATSATATATATATAPAEAAAAPELAPLRTPSTLHRGDVRADTAAQNPGQDWSDGFAPGRSRSACGHFTLFEDGRWEYALDPASQALAQVQPGLMLQETFQLKSRGGTRCGVSVGVSPAADAPGQWIISAQTQLQ